MSVNNHIWNMKCRGTVSLNYAFIYEKWVQRHFIHIVPEVICIPFNATMCKPSILVAVLYCSCLYNIIALLSELFRFLFIIVWVDIIWNVGKTVVYATIIFTFHIRVLRMFFSVLGTRCLVISLLCCYVIIQHTLWCCYNMVIFHHNTGSRCLITTQIANFMGPTWGPPGACRPQMGPMLAPWTLLSGIILSWHHAASWRCGNDF